MNPGPALVRGHGLVRITHGRNPAARLVARVFRMPAPGEAIEARLVVTPADEGERWLRTFGTRTLDTRQYPASDGTLAERIGPLEFRFRRDVVPEGTYYRQVGAALVAGPLRLTLPRWCAPRVVAREDPAGEHRVRIDVRVELPAIGPILTYAGTIDMEEPAKRAARRETGESEGQSPSDTR